MRGAGGPARGSRPEAKTSEAGPETMVREGGKESEQTRARARQAAPSRQLEPGRGRAQPREPCTSPHPGHFASL
eukprot:11167552-Lingulodinium_polyedra.AAC.1